MGSIRAERTITYWQNGQGRNFYEHIIDKQGHTHGDELLIKPFEDSWYLRIESLVSPHNRFRSYDDLVEWERQRQGPAQLAQPVTYKFYKKKSKSKSI